MHLVYPLPWLWLPINSVNEMRYRNAGGTNHLVYKEVSGVNHLTYCPSTPAEPCAGCNSGTTPLQVQATIPQVTYPIPGGGTCTLPAGDYVLDQSAINACVWGYSSDIVCGLATHGLELSITSFFVEIKWLRSAATLVHWRTAISLPINCAFSGYELGLYYYDDSPAVTVSGNVFISSV